MDRPRALTIAIRSAVEAAHAGDEDQLRAAAAELATLDGSSEVLGRLLRSLLEQHYPDGIDGDDVRTIIIGLPQGDPQILLVVLAGALGIHPTDEEVERPDAAALALHAPLLIAHLSAGRGIDRHLAVAFADIARNELMEAP